MRILIYLFPILVNFILGGVFFITAYRLAEAGAKPLAVTATMAVWAIVYSAVSMLMGRITTGRNAPRFIMLAGFGITATSLGFLLLPGLYWQYLWIIATGVASAVYCVPFQTFMKFIEPNQSAGTVRATALYTCAWSVGLASGPLVFGLLDWRIGFGVNAVLGLVVVAAVRGVVAYRARHPAPAASAPAASSPEAVDYRRYPDLAWVGWLAGGMGSVSTALVRTLLPYRAAQLEIARADIGLVLAVVSYVLGFSALTLVRSRTWMYKPLPALLTGFAGAAGLLLFALGRDLGSFFLGALLFGVYSGAFFFYLVFHALVHPEKSTRYVAVNELVVGSAGIAGPVAGGLLAGAGGAGAPFFLCAAATLLVALLQAGIFRLKTIRKQ